MCPHSYPRAGRKIPFNILSNRKEGKCRLPYYLSSMEKIVLASQLRGSGLVEIIAGPSKL